MLEKPLFEVMLSSTYVDLSEHRSYLRDELSSNRLHAIWMEDDASLSDEDMIDASLSKVAAADAYLCIIGKRYGKIRQCPDRNPRNLSLTELEFDHAIALGLPISVMIMGEAYPVPDSANEFDPDRRLKLSAFRDKVRADHRVTATFNSVEAFWKLAPRAVRDLRNTLERRRTGLESTPPPDEVATPATLSQVAEFLARELDRIDRDFNFQDSWFEPLEARVKVSQAASEDSLSDLLTELDDQGTGLTLVLGLPGSGKSVALREYARRASAKASASGILPVYVNLRDWVPDRTWTPADPPRRTDLERFLQAHLQYPARPDVTLHLARFRELHARSDILWIFDSFDELPAILDASEGAPNDLIRAVSHLLQEYILSAGAGGHAPRGIIASRYERKPILPPKHFKQVEIQPLSDDKIADAFDRLGDFPKHLVDELFRPPGSLVPLARIPFYHSLIAQHAQATGTLPAHTAELFNNYARRQTMAAACASGPQFATSVDAILITAEDIAYAIFSSNVLGLGAPLKSLSATLPSAPVEEAVAILVRARIMRCGPKPDQVVTFSHRRLHEYFVIRYRDRHQIPFEVEWVAGDRRERDSAVLTVELASPAEARHIASKLWTEIKNGVGCDYSQPQFYRALHCQRFLVEAFRSRREALDPFREELEALVLHRLADDDIILAKLAVETIGLLPTDGLEDKILAALRRGDAWIRETTIDACRFLPTLPPRVVGHVWRYLAFMNEDVLVDERARLEFSFRLSPALQEVNRLLDLRSRDIRRWHRYGWWLSGLLRFWWCIPAYLRSLGLGRIRKAASELERSFRSHPISMYSSDEALLYTHKTASEHGAFEPWLAQITQDPLYGLPNYRASLAGNSIFLWYTLATAPALGIVLAWLSAESLLASSAVAWLSTSTGVEPATWTFLGYVLAGYFLALVCCLLSIPLIHRPYSLEAPAESRTRPIAPGSLEKVRRSIGAWLTNHNLSGSSIFAGLVVSAFVIYISFGDPHLLTVIQSWMGPVAIFIGAIFMSVAAGVWLVEVYGHVRKALRARHARLDDAQQLATACASFPGTRAQIEAAFATFRTASYREVYVDWLAQQGFTPGGEWSTGRPPNHGDQASSKLARLEHRWRGLEK